MSALMLHCVTKPIELESLTPQSCNIGVIATLIIVITTAIRFLIIIWVAILPNTSIRVITVTICFLH
jgi:hypothetical protein